MPTNCTQNYMLSQWEPGDKVVRTDFNADNAKIDGALAAKAEVSALNSLSAEVSALQSALASLQTTVSKKQDTASAVQLAAGTYTGNGAASQTISLSFTPKAVLVIGATGHLYDGCSSSSAPHGGLAVTGSPAVGTGRSGQSPVVKISGKGFIVYQTSDYYGDISLSNTSGFLYHYIALG